MDVSFNDGIGMVWFEFSVSYSLTLDLIDDAWVSGPDLQRFTKNVLVIKIFYYWSDFDQTLWDWVLQSHKVSSKSEYFLSHNQCNKIWL